MKKVICYILGHKIGIHNHRPDDVWLCNGNCNPIINWDTKERIDYQCLRCGENI